jgi:hypothetical protein
MTTLHLRKSIGRSPLRHGLLLIAVALACFTLLPSGQAQLPPPSPDGGYPGSNTAEGDGALSSVQIGTSGVFNTAIGFDALHSNTTGDSNTATGYIALQANTTGAGNTATGFQALEGTTTGGNNTANGVGALANNTTANNNTATGYAALSHNSTGEFNTATGAGALQFTATGSFNTANGAEALFSNSGNENTANGWQALDNNAGTNNTATGASALSGNNTGSNNTANGVGVLQNNSAGSNNTATGSSALFSNTSGNNNTATGLNALHSNTTGGSNIALGFNAGGNLTTGSNNIDIGNLGVAGEAKKIRIGTVGTQTATFVAGIVGVTVPSGVGVIVGSNGQLGTVVSSERFKDQVKPMDKASEAILALKPVTFRYKHELDPDGIPQFGLVAEQVEKVNPDLVARDAKGEVYTVRYEAVNAMLLNEFLKEHKAFLEEQCKVEKQEKTIAELKSGLTALAATVKEQAAQIQKVSAQLEVSKPAPQTVLNSQ